MAQPFEQLDESERPLERMPVAPTWALVEKLAHESDRATVRDLEESISLAELGIWTAGRLSAPEALQAASREYSWVYLGNARRAMASFDEAKLAFARAKEVAPPVGFPSPFSRARMLDAEAKLYRDERRFGEALALQDQAFDAPANWIDAATVVLGGRGGCFNATSNGFEAASLFAWSCGARPAAPDNRVDHTGLECPEVGKKSEPIGPA